MSARKVDALFWREFMLPQASEDELRRRVDEAFKAEREIRGADSAELEEEIAMNVRNMLKEQQSPRRVVQRVRTDGKRTRLDQAILQGGQAVGPDVRLSDTYMMLGDRPTREGYKVFQILAGQLRTATIYPDDFVWAAPPVLDWILPPHLLMARVMFGRLEGDDLVLDKAKRDECIAQGGSLRGEWTIRVIPEAASGGSGQARDRLEFYKAGGTDGHPVLTAVCDREDYGRVYRSEARDPKTGALLKVQEVEAYDANGMPQRFRVESYGGAGQPIPNAETIELMGIELNPVLPDDVFEFRPPPGYAIVDLRRSPGRVIREGRPDAPEAGETVGEILGVLRTGPLTPGRRSWEVKIELPASRPATQPAGASGAATQPAAGGG